MNNNKAGGCVMYCDTYQISSIHVKTTKMDFRQQEKKKENIYFFRMQSNSALYPTYVCGVCVCEEKVKDGVLFQIHCNSIMSFVEIPL